MSVSGSTSSFLLSLLRFFHHIYIEPHFFSSIHFLSIISSIILFFLRFPKILPSPFQRAPNVSIDVPPLTYAPYLAQWLLPFNFPFILRPVSRPPRPFHPSLPPGYTLASLVSLPSPFSPFFLRHTLGVIGLAAYTIQSFRIPGAGQPRHCMERLSGHSSEKRALGVCRLRITGRPTHTSTSRFLRGCA